MRHIAFAADTILSKILSKHDLHLKKIIFNWADIIGPGLSEYTSPLKLEKKSEESILHLSVSNSAVSAEIHYLKNQIIEKITFFLGKPVVTDIKISFKPKEKKVS